MLADGGGDTMRGSVVAGSDGNQMDGACWDGSNDRMGVVDLVVAMVPTD